MMLNRLSLDQLLLLTGGAWLSAVLLVATAIATRSLIGLEEATLTSRADAVAKLVSRELVDPMLTGNRVAIFDILRRATGGVDELRYLCVVDNRGQVVADTFSGGCPKALCDLFRIAADQPVRFRTDQGPMLDVAESILRRDLGTVHVGFSRSGLVLAVRRLQMRLGAVFVLAAVLLLAGTRVVAKRIALPLRVLEQQISRFPDEAPENQPEEVSGTREVDALARGFAGMKRRLSLLERERAATQHRMIHAERLASLGQLAAGLAHEIHNPLDGMQECVRYLQTDPQRSDRAAKYYPMLHSGLERIAQTMRGMLTFARSGQDSSMEPCNVQDMMKSLALLVEAQFGERRVHFTWSEEGCGVCQCARQPMTQALLNLVLNAAQAVEGNPTPEVSVCTHCDTEWVYFFVDDNGQGVPPELRPDIFKPFFSTKPIGKGTGLGLSVSRDLVRAMGGDLFLDPAPSPLGGARFVIQLPKVTDTENRDGRRKDENSHRRR